MNVYDTKDNDTILPGPIDHCTVCRRPRAVRKEAR